MGTRRKCYPGYCGKRSWSVRHPAHRSSVRVIAPTEEAAIVAAAEYWGERWTAVDFYDSCEVSPA